MKILIINSTCGVGSTGKICVELAEQFESKGDFVRIGYGRGVAPILYEKYAYKIGNKLGVNVHWMETKILDNHGLASSFATKKFLKWADSFNPDLLWLHNLHGYYINIEMLFDWIKSRKNMKVKWTLHDCWAFTGHCAHFTLAKCSKWKEECNSCPQKKEYPASYVIDRSYFNYNKKKELFTGVKNMKIVTPSNWLAKMVKESFLSEYKIEIVHNTIDENIFKPRESKFREVYGIGQRKIILGVASIWTENKGFLDFINLATNFIDEKKEVIVLVGLSDVQIDKLPNTCIGIKRTNNAIELAEIYTAADVFINLTYEDTYPTVNLEAKACGTEVVTYNTGGSPESVKKENVIEPGDINNLWTRVNEILYR